jgi:DNA-damage-inducible protein J
MAETTMMHVRIDAETKAKAAEVLGGLGLSVSDAVRLLLNRVVAEKRLPLSFGLDSSLSPDEVRQIQTESMSDFLARLRKLGTDDVDIEAIIQEHRAPHRGIDLE